MIPALALSIALSVSPAMPASTPPPVTAPASSAVMNTAHLPYSGKYALKGQRKYTLCILKRESNNHWFSTNRSGGYAGGFQFSYALARGATWMITPELKAMFGSTTGRAIAAKLRSLPMQRWSPYYQHMAFATVLNWEDTYSGAQHWAGGRFACNPT